MSLKKHNKKLHNKYIYIYFAPFIFISTIHT